MTRELILKRLTREDEVAVVGAEWTLTMFSQCSSVAEAVQEAPQEEVVNNSTSLRGD